VSGKRIKKSKTDHILYKPTHYVELQVFYFSYNNTRLEALLYKEKELG